MGRGFRRSINMAAETRQNLDDLGSSAAGGGRGFRGKVGRKGRRRRGGPPGMRLANAARARHRRTIAALIGVIAGLVLLLLVESWFLL